MRSHASKAGKLSLPAVRNVTSLEVRFAAQVDPAGDWRAAGSARFVVYPAGLDAQLKALVIAAQAQGSGKIAVFGKSSDLRSALQSVSIPFEDIGESLPDELDLSVVYLGQCSQRDSDTLGLRVRSRGRVIAFVSDSTQLPGVYWNPLSAGYLARVTMPLLLDFPRSPQRLAALLELFQHAFSTSKTSP